MEVVATVIIAYSFYYLIFHSNDKSLMYCAYYLLLGVSLLVFESVEKHVASLIYLTVLLNLFYLIYRKKNNA